MSENFIVSARKYRPDNWDKVIGQKSVTSTLQNAIANNQVAQAYLFTGPRGIGKTTCARIFARAVNGQLEASEQDIHFNIFELDAASNNSVDDIRQIVDSVRIPPQTGRFKVYIIDEVHMLSQAAFNAFLKTLEEPPAHAIFILATTEKHKIIPTILSRCQIFDFSRIRVRDIADHLASIARREGITAENEALHVIAQKADGAMRDALSIFDQVVAFCGRNLTYQNVIQNLNVLDYDYYFRLTDFILAEDVPSSLVLFNEVLDKGFDAHHFITGLGAHFRNLLVCRDPQTIALLEVSEGIAEKYKVQAASCELQMLIRGMEFINTCDIQYRTSKHQRLLVELTLLQLCSIPYNEREGEKKKFRLIPFRGAPLPADAVRLKAGPSSLPKLPAPPSVPAEQETVLEAPLLPQTTPSPGRKKFVLASSESISITKNLVKSAPEIQDQSPASETNLIDQPVTFFDRATFESEWLSFAERIRSRSASLCTTLIKQPHEVSPTGDIRLFLANPVQEMDIENIRTELLDHLKRRLSNPGFTLTTEILRPEELKSVIKSTKEKFDEMVRTNPHMDLLRKKFNLIIDF